MLRNLSPQTMFEKLALEHKPFFRFDAKKRSSAESVGNTKSFFTTDYTDSTDCFKQYTNAVFLRCKHILYQKRPYVQEPNIIDYPCNPWSLFVYLTHTFC